MARPRKWSDPEKLQKAIDEYFNSLPEDTPPVWEEIMLKLDITRETWQLYKTGLAGEDLSLFNSLSDNQHRTKLEDNEYKRLSNIQDVSCIIKKTEQRMTAEIVRTAYKHPNLTTAMIYLTKQQHYGGYTDKQQSDNNGSMSIDIKLSGASGEAFEDPEKTDK